MRHPNSCCCCCCCCIHKQCNKLRSPHAASTICPPSRPCIMSQWRRINSWQTGATIWSTYQPSSTIVVVDGSNHQAGKSSSCVTLLSLRSHIHCTQNALQTPAAMHRPKRATTSSRLHTRLLYCQPAGEGSETSTWVPKCTTKSTVDGSQGCCWPPCLLLLLKRLVVGCQPEPALGH